MGDNDRTVNSEPARTTGSVVLVHGLGHDPHQLDPVVDGLAPWHTITPNLHRTSVEVVDHQIRSLVATLGSVLDQSQGVPVIGGVSMGAAVTLLHALERPRALGGLVQIAPAVGPQGISDSARTYVEWMASVVEGGGFAELRQRVLESDLSEADRSGQIEAIDGWERRFPPDVLTVAWRGFIESAEPIDRAALADLDLPVLIVAWDSDPLHPLEIAEWYAAQMPHAELATVDTPIDGRIPATVGIAISRFLRKLPAQDR